jgi:hypothetical protein
MSKKLIIGVEEQALPLLPLQLEVLLLLDDEVVGLLDGGLLGGSIGGGLPFAPAVWVLP